MTIDDLYALSTHNKMLMEIVTGVVTIVAVLVIVQIILKIIEANRIATILLRVEKLLDMIEMHGSVTDHQKERMMTAIAQVQQKATETADLAKEAVDKIPDKVVAKLHESTGGTTP